MFIVLLTNLFVMPLFQFTRHYPAHYFSFPVFLYSAWNQFYPFAHESMFHEGVILEYFNQNLAHHRKTELLKLKRTIGIPPQMYSGTTRTYLHQCSVRQFFVTFKKSSKNHWKLFNARFNLIKGKPAVRRQTPNSRKTSARRTIQPKTEIATSSHLSEVLDTTSDEDDNPNQSGIEEKSAAPVTPVEEYNRERPLKRKRNVSAEVHDDFDSCKMQRLTSSRTVRKVNNECFPYFRNAFIKTMYKISC